jgi:hypothetical protein
LNVAGPVDIPVLHGLGRDSVEEWIPGHARDDETEALLPSIRSIRSESSIEKGRSRLFGAAF